MGAIDIHTHAFPDALAQRAMAHLEQGASDKPFLDGTLGALLRSMDIAGIERAILASIATKPEQFDPILRWSRSIASDRIIPFPSVHPSDPEASDRIRQIAAGGFKGIKLHPYYQGFTIDDDRLAPLYETVCETGLILLLHTGFDPAFDRDRIADPVRIAHVAEAYPALKLVSTHMGAWEDWDEVERHLIGKPIAIDTSHSIPFMGKGRAKDLLKGHPKEYIFFGSDSPWSDQAQSIADLRSFGFGEEWEHAVLCGNAERLLASVPAATPFSA